MASRRMFSKNVVEKASFLRMPLTTQALYFHLGVHADDDGIVEAFKVLRMVNGNEDDLRVLASKNFIKILNEDLVTFITDWSEHNVIRADRKQDSIYQDLLVQIIPDVKPLPRKPRADRPDTNGTSQGQQMDGIGKDRLGKDRLDNNINIIEEVKKTKEPKQPDTRITDVIEYLKQQANIPSLDGTDKQNRFATSNLFKKLKKLYPDRDEVKLAKDIILIALQDKYLAAQVTNINYIYYNMQKIILNYQARAKSKPQFIKL